MNDGLASGDLPAPVRSGRVTGWLDRLSTTRNDIPIWFSASFAETLIVPIPIELVLIPYMALNRDRLWRTALIVTLGCLAAALVGYAIGLLLFDTVGTGIIDWMGWSDGMARFRELFAQHGFWAIVAVGVIPIPFQVAMLAAGAAGYPIVLFVLAAAVSRGARYFGLAALVWWLGDAAEDAFTKHKNTVFIVLTLLVVGISAWLFLSI